MELQLLEGWKGIPFLELTELLFVVESNCTIFELHILEASPDRIAQHFCVDPHMLVMFLLMLLLNAECAAVVAEILQRE